MLINLDCKFNSVGVNLIFSKISHGIVLIPLEIECVVVKVFVKVLVLVKVIVLIQLRLLSPISFFWTSVCGSYVVVWPALLPASYTRSEPLFPPDHNGF